MTPHNASLRLVRCVHHRARAQVKTARVVFPDRSRSGKTGPAHAWGRGARGPRPPSRQRHQERVRSSAGRAARGDRSHAEPGRSARRQRAHASGARAERQPRQRLDARGQPPQATSPRPARADLDRARSNQGGQSPQRHPWTAARAELAAMAHAGAKQRTDATRARLSPRKRSLSRSPPAGSPPCRPARRLRRTPPLHIPDPLSGASLRHAPAGHPCPGPRQRPLAAGHDGRGLDHGENPCPV